jgi:hypothetical protein
MDFFKVTHENFYEEEVFRITITQSDLLPKLIIPSPKVIFNLMYCTYQEDEIAPLLNGEDFYYTDNNFSITQKDGLTTFQVGTSIESSIEISIPFRLCEETLKAWVENSDSSSEDN